jgi:heat shock protein 4
MFYDMGSSTTGAAIVEFFKGKLKVVAAAYNHNLGGRDFDNVLTEHFLKEFQVCASIFVKLTIVGEV